MLWVVGDPLLHIVALPWRIGNRSWQNVLDPRSDIIVSDRDPSNIFDCVHDPGDVFDSISDPGAILDSICDPGAIFSSVCDPGAILFGNRDPHPSLWLVE